MGIYKDILEKVNKDPESYKFNKVSNPTIEWLLGFSDIRQDYIDFLKEVGYGCVGDIYLKFYGVLIEAAEIYATQENLELDNVLLLGGKLSGDSIGFLTTDDWSIVEVWNEDLSIISREEKTFKEFVRKVFAKDL
ncbi:SMI1/KNR4 family protein [Metabacillus fastidiosus]|uniref:SMI1/KNR4 family protein n=1 Tax=Metabacillus fastidiosus TaxID=1458 RepID=UPI003D2B75E8